MIKKIVFLSLVFLVSCVTQKKHGDNSSSKFSSEIDVIIGNVKEHDSISFKVQNKSKGKVFIHNHRQIHIERLMGDNWVKLRILACPCGAPCAKPSEFIEIATEDNYMLSWDKTESWCGEMNSYGIPESFKSLVSSGVYRIMVLFSLDQKNPKVFYKEFNV